MIHPQESTSIAPWFQENVDQQKNKIGNDKINFQKWIDEDRTSILHAKNLNVQFIYNSAKNPSNQIILHKCACKIQTIFCHFSIELHCCFPLNPIWAVFLWYAIFQVEKQNWKIKAVALSKIKNKCLWVWNILNQKYVNLELPFEGIFLAFIIFNIWISMNAGNKNNALESNMPAAVIPTTGIP